MSKMTDMMDAWLMAKDENRGYSAQQYYDWIYEPGMIIGKIPHKSALCNNPFLSEIP